MGFLGKPRTNKFLLHFANKTFSGFPGRKVLHQALGKSRKFKTEERQFFFFFVLDGVAAVIAAAAPHVHLTLAGNLGHFLHVAWQVSQQGFCRHL